MHHSSKRGFTLIELLTVVAIIGILAAILIPTIGAAQTSAKKAKTRVQFNQWASSMNLFKQEYGYYPAIASSNKLASDVFFAALTGKTYSGGTPSDYKGNTKHMSFYSASDNEISLIANGDAADGLLKDAFGNTDIAVFVDTNADGIINSSDGLSLQSVKSADTGSTWTPSTSNINTSTGVRAGVIFYSAGKGYSASDIVYSWQ